MSSIKISKDQTADLGTQTGDNEYGSPVVDKLTPETLPEMSRSKVVIVMLALGVCISRLYLDTAILSSE
jgi:hypothetical protein